MTQSPLRSKLRLERTDERSNVLAFHDLEVRHHEVEGQEPAMHGQLKRHMDNNAYSTYLQPHSLGALSFATSSLATF